MSGKPHVEKLKLICDNEACPQPNREFLAYPSRIKQAEKTGRKVRFCSRPCHDAVMRPGPVCTKCGGPNNRGRRTRVCEACLATTPEAAKKERARLRLAQCPPGKRWCTDCDRFLPPNVFASKENCCAPCQAASQRSQHLKRTYGIDAETYNKLLAAQLGRCAICGSKPRKKLLHVDHDHKTGIVRGLLCTWCNHRLLGGAKESLEILQSAVRYLSSPPAVKVIGVKIAPAAPRTNQRRPGTFSTKKRRKAA